MSGYVIQEDTLAGWADFALYGTNEPDALANARWYNRLCNGRRVFRVVLRTGNSVAVIRG